MSDSQFRIRQAIHADVTELRALIESSVRQLQKNDYTPAQIEGALGHALGLTPSWSKMARTSRQCRFQSPT